MKHLKCILDSVDQRYGMGLSIDLFEANILTVNDCGDFHRFKVTDDQLKQVEDSQSIELALSFKG